MIPDSLSEVKRTGANLVIGESAAGVRANAEAGRETEDLDLKKKGKISVFCTSC